MFTVRAELHQKKNAWKPEQDRHWNALAHLYVVNEKTFEFFKIDNPIPLKDIGSFRI